MKLRYFPNQVKTSEAFNISGSKSESNRLLILQSIFGNISLSNLSNAKDTEVLKNALENNEDVVDVGHAGTAMRFLTAYLSVKTKKTVTLKGSKRMHQRPIKILVDALTSLGANITYLENDGYPPLQISPSNIIKDEIELDASISSQYITALMLIAPTLENGLKIILKGKITSLPYLTMTVSMMEEAGFKLSFQHQQIQIFPSQSIHKKQVEIESDWSSASYIYSAFLLSKMEKLQLSTYFKESKQGDAYVVGFFERLGVKTSFDQNALLLKKVNVELPKQMQIDLNQTPDLAQTFAVVGLILGIDMHFTGLATLKIKETDRIEALKTEMEKLGAKVDTGNDYLAFTCPSILNSNQLISTYQDHRMAMAFALVAFKTSVRIENPEVVNKSYPNFWKDLEKFGVVVS